jgi:hypothetical protein
MDQVTHAAGYSDFYEAFRPYSAVERARSSWRLPEGSALIVAATDRTADKD